MPAPTIFLINKNNEIVELSNHPYDSERRLQELLSKFPNILAGDQMSGGTPVKWLLVSREAGIPDEEGGRERWSLDHVFIDQDGIPAFVEVKRSTDTRIRREVVGQMLDYAANAVLYWPIDTIRQRFEGTCRDRGLEPGMAVADFIGLTAADNAESMIERFWETVETNLRAGKIRLIFAADVIPGELQRIVEFLNKQMNPAEVLAIEIRQYVGNDVRTLVPRVIGSSKRAATASSRPSSQWGRESFINALEERRGSGIAAVAGSILDWTPTHCPILWWGEGRKDGSRFVGVTHNGVNYYPFAMWTYGRIEMQFQWLRQRSLTEELMEALASRLNAISGVMIPPDSLTRRPTFEMSVLKEQQPLSQFFDAIEWFVEQIRAGSEPATVSVPV